MVTLKSEATSCQTSMRCGCGREEGLVWLAGWGCAACHTLGPVEGVTRMHWLTKGSLLSCLMFASSLFSNLQI